MPISSSDARSASKSAKPPIPRSLREVLFAEQAELVDRARQRLGGLDLDPAVALEPGRGRDQLADDDVLLQPVEAVDLALERGVGEHLRRLLEGGRREERVGVQRCLGDAEDDVLELRRLAAGLGDLLGRPRELEAIDELSRQVLGVALLVDPDLLEHLAHDQLDVLVVDVDALGLVDRLDLLDEVLLGLGAPAHGEQLVRVQRALVELAPGRRSARPRVTCSRVRRGKVWRCSSPASSVITTVSALSDSSIEIDAVLLGDLRQALRLARLEQLDDARQAVRDVRAGDAAGVERSHRQLRARLADRLRGDDADRVADLGDLAGRHRAAVAGLADARTAPRT